MSGKTPAVVLAAGTSIYLLWGAFAQEAAPAFQLILPDFREAPFDDGRTIIELPERPLKRMDVLVLKAQEKGISPSAVKIWVNGKGIGNILEGRNVTEGTRFSMDPSTLRMRP